MHALYSWLDPTRASSLLNDRHTIRLHYNIAGAIYVSILRRQLPQNIWQFNLLVVTLVTPQDVHVAKIYYDIVVGLLRYSLLGDNGRYRGSQPRRSPAAHTCITHARNHMCIAVCAWHSLHAL